MSLCPSVRIENLGFQWTDFHEILYLRVSRELSREFLMFSLKCCKNNGHFAWTAAYICDSKSKGLPRQAEVAQGVPGRLRPRIILTFRHYKGGRSSAKNTGRLYLRRNPWYSLSEAESTPGHMVLSGGTTEKIPSYTIRNRSRDLTTSSAVP